MKIFLDVDGVFADFDRAIETLGIPRTEHHSNDIWKYLNQVPNFFYKLEVMHGSIEIIKELQAAGHDLEFLTALPIPTGLLATADADKRRWLPEKISSTIPINTVVGGKNKVRWLVNNPGAVLIDDYERNINLWREHGGIGILHTSVKNTLHELKMLGLTHDHETT